MLIQEGNESDATSSDPSKLEQDKPNEMKTESCDSQNKKPEGKGCLSKAAEEQASDQHMQKEVNARSAKDDKVSASKPRSRKRGKNRAKKTENNAQQNKNVTDYFPIRRSNRKTKAELKIEEHKHIDDLIKNGIEEGMEILQIEGKGRGIFATRDFKKGEFVMEYHGDLLELAEAKRREAQYARDPQTGCYMYYFQYQCKTYCVDATRETGRLGRLLNHSKTGNCQTKLHAIDGVPHLILVTSRDIKAKEELLYDYGKKNVLRTDKRSQDAAGHKSASPNETKENEPASSKDSISKVPPIFSLRSPRKPRSPLSDGSSMLIQEGNESDATSSEPSKLEQDKPNEMKTESCDSQNKKPEGKGCLSKAAEEQASDQHMQKEVNARSAKDDKVSASKPRSRKRGKNRAKKTENNAQQNKKVTDYFPIRRSNRKTKAELKIEEHKHIDDLIKNGIEEGMEIQQIEGKGRGIFATRDFKKGEFVVEYHGDLLELAEAKRREAQYARDPQTGCYMYYFQYQCKTYCVDATRETGRLGRLLNHSKTGNCQTKLHAIDGVPHLILVTSRDIKAKEELLYDYGDRSKDSILAHPWLKY
ncbi:lysine methyltransferase 5Ab isoform X2 [Betta splendens]|uniref:[histone H4]-lysine(20) N-methyltransferase n=1 Tax=Betta splendens TaxID=158456 RepID=A0A9W2Y0C3_BETSP|nr:lysine methyltransferase 5Ab isoform X2 [Betta splendens]